ncbi:hypothetical protein B9Z55_006974 [Caenorhabditis nigoni]|uniref:F-box associated domain-containing protein n=1 Tax=Caenorhabditis nigoni TaxID=1611254 RepID=A0A2G5V7L8_9PELO|nr:hypothetical protein B9Z55_006974 [Caenorhabditis nigoni]
MNYTGEIPAKNIRFYRCDDETVVTVLQKLSNGVESIKLRWRENEYTYVDDVLAVSQVQKAKYWHMELYKQSDSLHKVAQMWINKNSQIGFTFQVSVLFADDSFEEFLKIFAERIVSKSDKRVRIRTNNPDRHILLERGFDDVVRIDRIVGIDYQLQIFRLMVISVEMEESEYDENCKEWICKMSPWVYYNNYHY